jgi:hypothetical protein
VSTPATPFDILHTEHLRVAWVDTDAGGRIHWSAVFRWAELAEHALLRSLGRDRGEAGPYPRRSAEVIYHHPLEFDDEFERGYLGTEPFDSDRVTLRSRSGWSWKLGRPETAARHRYRPLPFLGPSCWTTYKGDRDWLRWPVSAWCYVGGAVGRSGTTGWLRRPSLQPGRTRRQSVHPAQQVQPQFPRRTVCVKRSIRTPGASAATHCRATRRSPP